MILHITCILRIISHVISEKLKGAKIKMLQIGDIIKKLRIENKYTQNELAIMLGLQLSTLQKYESGMIQNLKLETIRELCHIFEVPPIMFVFPNMSKKETRCLIKWAIKEYTELNEEACEKVEQYIDDLGKIEQYRKKST